MDAREPRESGAGARRPPPAPRRASRAAVALLAASALALAAPWLRPVDRRTEVDIRTHALVSLEREPLPGQGRGLERWRLIGPDADTVTALWRPPAPGAATGGEGAPEWTVVLLGGIGTDDRAALLVPDRLPAGVLAVSWPWKGSRRMGWARFVASIPALRASLLRTPLALARGVEAVRRVRPGARLAMVGASLGVPPTVAALPLVRADALVLVGGAADLGRLLRSETARALGGGPIAAGAATLAAPLGAWLLGPLEPSGVVVAARAIPTLLVDAESEERLPRACVERLHSAFPHATRALHPGAHLRPEDEHQMSVILDTAWDWMRQVGGGD